LKDKGNSEKANDINSKISKFSVESCNNKIVLATLSTSLKNTYSNYLKVGDELYDCNRDIETETCSRMMNILKLNVVPSRKNLITFIESNKIIDSCSGSVQQLYRLIEGESNPLVMAKSCWELLQHIEDKQYTDLIMNNLIIKCLLKMTTLYDSISIQRLEKLFPHTNRQVIEDIIIENTRVGVLNCIIDHATSIVKFKTHESIKIDLTEKLTELTSSVQHLAGEILSHNRKKIITLNHILNNELNAHNNNSLKIYDGLVYNIESKLKELQDYSKFKTQTKEEEKKKRHDELEQKKKEAEENAKRQKELQKDENLRKELDLQLKKFLIDRLHYYTNIIVVDSKKLKLEDLQKDLNKVSSETLIQVLEQEEINFKTKKEKKFKEVAKENDYMLREFRRRDNEVYIKELIEEEKKFNELQEQNNKKKYDAGILLKDNLLTIKDIKEKWFKEQIIQKTEIYNNDMAAWKQKLEKRVQDDFESEIFPYFKNYIEDFRKKLEEERKRNPQQASRNFGFVKGQQVSKIEEKPRMQIGFASKCFFNFRGFKSR
jgi:hypothetical protein